MIYFFKKQLFKSCLEYGLMAIHYYSKCKDFITILQTQLVKERLTVKECLIKQCRYQSVVDCNYNQLNFLHSH